MNKEIIICDLDGTIADCEHRRHYIISAPKNWDAFYGGCSDDTPIKSIIRLVNLFHKDGVEIVYVSGRRASCEAATLEWLSKHGLPQGKLFIRAEGDYRQDYIVKEEILDTKILTNIHISDILFALDDRNQVVNMWRKRGIKCLQVADGDF